MIWDGITFDQRVDVVFRVIMGESRNMWFDDMRLEKEVAEHDMIRGVIRNWSTRRS